MSEKTRTCTMCGQTKPLSDFGPQRRGKHGKRARCRPCHSAQTGEGRREMRARMGFRRHMERIGATKAETDAVRSACDAYLAFAQRPADGNTWDYETAGDVLDRLGVDPVRWHQLATGVVELAEKRARAGYVAPLPPMVDRPTRKFDTTAKDISERQKEDARAMLRCGLTHQQIASELGVSPKWVYNHISKPMREEQAA